MLCFFWLEDCPGHSRLCSAWACAEFWRGLCVCRRSLGWPPGLSGKSCLCPAEGRGLGRRGGCPLFRGSQLLLKTASLDAGQMAPFLLACCSSVLVQSPVWCLGRAVPRWLEELGAWGRGDLSETLHCRALPLLPGSRPHLLPVPHLLNADKVPVSQKLGES